MRVDDQPVAGAAVGRLEPDPAPDPDDSEVATFGSFDDDDRQEHTTVPLIDQLYGQGYNLCYFQSHLIMTPQGGS